MKKANQTTLSVGLLSFEFKLDDLFWTRALLLRLSMTNFAIKTLRALPKMPLKVIAKILKTF